MISLSLTANHSPALQCESAAKIKHTHTQARYLRAQVCTFTRICGKRVTARSQQAALQLRDCGQKPGPAPPPPLQPSSRSEEDEESAARCSVTRQLQWNEPEWNRQSPVSLIDPSYRFESVTMIDPRG